MASEEMSFKNIDGRTDNGYLAIRWAKNKKQRLLFT